jgi:hypothetical protein
MLVKMHKILSFIASPPFQAVVNGNLYQPAVAVDNKKAAKANAAWLALQELGFVNKDLANPL